MNNKVMISQLRHWKPNMSIFQVMVPILNIFKKPDDTEQFFEFNALNREAFNLYNLDKE